MTYRNDFTLPAELMEQVQEHGLEFLPGRYTQRLESRKLIAIFSAINYLSRRD